VKFTSSMPCFSAAAPNAASAPRAAPLYKIHSSAFIINAPIQYTGRNIEFGPPTDRAWQDSVSAALCVMGGAPDPTGGATFYFDKSPLKNPPRWASTYVHTADIGAFRFYKP
jgi:hypothetical protein